MDNSNKQQHMNDRTNFGTMAQLEKACNEARTILRRRHPTSDNLLHAALQLNKAVRTLRSWLGTRNDELRHARRLTAGCARALERKLLI